MFGLNEWFRRRFNLSNIAFTIGSIAIVFIIALAVGAILILLVGANPILAYSRLFGGAFTNLYGFSETLVVATPLLLLGLGLEVGFKCNLTNLGCEGQLYAGAVGATFAALFLPVPTEFRLLSVVMAGAVAGGLYALIPAILKAKLNVNEVIIGLMLNFVAIDITDYLVEGPWLGHGFESETRLFPSSAILPRIGPEFGQLSIGFFIALISMVVVYVLLAKTTIGYEIKVAGEGKQTAETSGINVLKAMIIAMFVSGVLCGLAGMTVVSGAITYLPADFSPGYGYYALVLPFMGRRNLFGILVGSVIFSAMLTQATLLQSTVGVPVEIVYVIIGLILVSILASEPLENKLRKRFT